MKFNRNLMIAILSLALLTNVVAQETKISDLQTPPSPAFVLLGIESASLSKPTTPRAVAANFISAVQQGGAFEVAPYWLSSHPRLTFNDYYNAGFGQTILQTLSISFATVPKTAASDTLGTRVGLGVSLMLVAGSPRDSLIILRDKILATQKEYNETDDTVKQGAIMKKLKGLSLQIQKEDHKRTGFSLSMASAFTMNFLDNKFGNGKFDKWGVWLTSSYLLDEPSIDMLLVARVIGNSRTEGTQNVFDFGGRLVASLDDISISCEYIQRTEINISRTAGSAGLLSSNFFLKNTYRLTGNLEYKYSNDFSVFLTFGRNFTSEKEANNSLVALVGLNLGLGNIPLIGL